MVPPKEKNSILSLFKKQINLLSVLSKFQQILRLQSLIFRSAEHIRIPSHGYPWLLCVISTSRIRFLVYLLGTL